MQNDADGDKEIKFNLHHECGAEDIDDDDEVICKKGPPVGVKWNATLRDNISFVNRFGPYKQSDIYSSNRQ